MFDTPLLFIGRPSRSVSHGQNRRTAGNGRPAKRRTDTEPVNRSRVCGLFLLSCALLSPADAGLAQDVQTRAHQSKQPAVVASIKPLHSLVQGVMGGTGQARLLLEGDASPHGFSFKPSQIKMLHDADVVFYVADALESFLPDALAVLPAHVRRVPVVEKASLTTLEGRKGGAWEAHGHHGHRDEGHRGHKDEAHGHRGEARHGHRSGEHHGHRHEKRAHDCGGDMHVWLDAGNAKEIIHVVASELGAVHPENRSSYERNARALIARVDVVDVELKNELAGVKDRPFIVFHDAYQYFERRYGLSGVGSITLEPNESPSANRIREIREKIKTAGVVCVFREPQFSDKLVRTAVQGDGIKIGTLDPLGSGLEGGPDLYFDLLGNLGKEFKRCLS